MYTVYVIKSSTTDKIYIGQTDDLGKRLRQHNDIDFDKRSYTKLNGRDWKLVYSEEVKTRSEALAREKQLKSFQGRTFIRNNILAR